MQNRIKQLFMKQLEGTISPQEQLELNDLKARLPEVGKMLENLSSDPRHLLKMVRLSAELDEDAAWQRVSGESPSPFTPVRFMWRYAAAAAAIVILAGFAWFYFSRSKQNPPLAEKEKTKVDFLKAFLRRSDGSVMQLTMSDTNIAYASNTVSANLGTDTLETEKKSFYRLRLPDGSMAWLNATSNLTFPASFSDTDRVVDLEGEAYFEVVRNTTKPFKVRVHGMDVRVVGTRFNVKAYKEDGIVRTTLFEGSVKVHRGNQTDSLKVGDQAILNGAGKLKIISLNDSALKQALAWTENQFKWEHEDIEYIISDISHWYGYDINYQINVSGISYTGTIKRSKPIEEVLDIIAKNRGLTINVVDNTIVVRR